MSSNSGVHLVFLFLMVVGLVLNSTLATPEEIEADNSPSRTNQSSPGSPGTIIVVPDLPCPEGQQRDWRGNCRPVFGARKS